MTENIIVLVTSGKNESVYKVSAHIFNNRVEANLFVIANSDTEKSKHWKYAEIVANGEVMELVAPDYFN